MILPTEKESCRHGDRPRTEVEQVFYKAYAAAKKVHASTGARGDAFNIFFIRPMVFNPHIFPTTKAMNKKLVSFPEHAVINRGEQDG